MSASGLHAAGKDGGSVRTPAELGAPRAVAVGKDHVYVGDLDSGSSHGAGIVPIAKTVGESRVVDCALTRRLALRGEDLFWTEAQKSKTRIRSLRLGASGKAKPVDVLDRTAAMGRFGAPIPLDLLVADDDIFIVDCRPGGHILSLVPPAKVDKPFTTREAARFGVLDRVELLGSWVGVSTSTECGELARFDVLKRVLWRPRARLTVSTHPVTSFGR